MCTKKIPIVFAICFLVFRGAAFAQSDMQFWNTEAFEGSTGSFKIAIEEEFRFGNDFTDYWYTHTEVGLNYKINPILSVGGGYRQAYEKKKGIWRSENRPTVHISLNSKWHGLTIRDRNRFEYRVREASTTMWCYRNKFNVALPIRWTKKEIQPFLSDELFVDMTVREINRNRFFVGVQLKIVKHVKGETYYLMQTSKGIPSWITFHVVGSKLKFEF